MHAGIVMTVDQQDLLLDRITTTTRPRSKETRTIAGSSGRGYTCKLRRRLSPTLGERFVRWCEFDASVTGLTERAA